jgi:ligand-binding sensor domain-containing protein
LQDNDFWAACKTRDGLLWIGSFNLNFYKINPYRVSVPYTHTGDVINAFAEDNAQTLWLATDKGLVHLDSKGVIHKLSIDKDSSSNKNQILFIQKDNNNRLWLATLHGLYYIDSGTNKIVGYHSEVGYTNSMYPDTVLMINIVKDNKPCLATSRGLKILDVNSGNLTTYLHDPEDTNSLDQDYISSLTTDKNEGIWVGTLSGINSLTEIPVNSKDIPESFRLIVSWKTARTIFGRARQMVFSDMIGILIYFYLLQIREE